MVFLSSQTMTVLNGLGPKDIEKWDVWFETPNGLCQDLTTAVKRCEADGHDPNRFIIPVPVALVGEHYEKVIRG